MSAPPPSRLDANQVLQASYDEAVGALRVEGIISGGAIQVSIDASTDNIAIKDPSSGNTLKVNSDGSINTTLIVSSIEIGKVDQGSPNTIANAWPVKVTDGTNTLAITAGGQIQTALTAPLPAGTNAIGSVSVSNFPATQAVSAVSLPLPTGASTSALQTTGNTSLSSIDGKTPALGQAVMASSSPVVIASNQSAIPVTGTFFQTTQPVSGTVTATISGTPNVAVTSSVLPTGASTSALQTTGNTSLSSIDSKTPALGQALAASSVPVVLTVSQLTTLTPLTTVAVTQSTSPWVVSGTVTGTNSANGTTGTAVPTQATQIGGTDGTNLHALSVNTSGQLNVNNISGAISLPTGAATSALQTTGNTSLATIATNTPAVGQATMAASSPVVIASNQSAIAVTGTFFQATQPVSGTVTVTQSTGTNLHAVIDSGTVSISNFPATQAVTQSTSPWIISGTVTSNAGTNLNTSALALDTSVNGLLVTQGSATSGEKGPLIQGAVTTAAPTYSTTQTNPLSLTTAGALRTDSSATTQPISAASLPLPTGASTAAGLTTINTTLGSPFQAGGSIGNTSFAVTQATASSLNATIIGTGTAGTPSAGIVTIQGNASGTPIPITGSITATNPSVSTTGTAVPTSATLTGGTDGTNLRAFKVSTAGVLSVDGSAVTQPISGTITANAGTGNFTVTQATGTNLHTVIDSGTITTVSAVTAITNALPAGTNVIGALSANQSVNIAQVAGATTQTGNGTNTGSIRVAIASDNTAFSVNATPPSITKGTQGSTGYTVQSLIDSGRTSIAFSAVNVAAGTTTTETAITLTKSAGTGATSSAASFVITSGKTFRINAIMVASRANAVATTQATTFNLRLNTGGAVTTTSTPILMSLHSGTPATASAYDRYFLEIPDGYEIVGNGTIQFGITANATYLTNAPTWDVTIVGFEY